MNDRRLIERWLLITELGIESVRERTPMTPFPAPNRLHVWWARRALVAVRAAVLAYLLPGRCGQSTVVACHWNRWRSRGGPETDRRRDPQGERLGAAAYGYTRAFKHSLSADDREWLSATIGSATVPDPTAGVAACRLSPRAWGSRRQPTI